MSIEIDAANKILDTYGISRGGCLHDRIFRLGIELERVQGDNDSLRALLKRDAAGVQTPDARIETVED